MHCEYPIREEHVVPFLRRHVGVVLLDGTRHYGVVESCAKGCLVLKPFAADSAEEAEVESTRTPSRRRRSKRTKTKAALPPAAPVPFGPPVPYGPPPFAYGAPLTLELATIAVLFALLP